MDKFEPIDLFGDGTGMVSKDFESVSEKTLLKLRMQYQKLTMITL